MSAARRGEEEGDVQRLLERRSAVEADVSERRRPGGRARMDAAAAAVEERCLIIGK